MISASLDVVCSGCWAHLVLIFFEVILPVGIGGGAYAPVTLYVAAAAAAAYAEALLNFLSYWA
jgi:hypothetical protein